MSRSSGSKPRPDAPVYVISVAAELTGLHPQTLRTYERLGLITPRRAGGGGRRYSARDVELLRSIAELTSSGIGIEGVRRILELEDRIAALSARNEELGAELSRTRAALRRALAARRGRPPLELSGRADPPGNRAVVLWRAPPPGTGSR